MKKIACSLAGGTIRVDGGLGSQHNNPVAQKIVNYYFSQQGDHDDLRLIHCA
jgi:hypothetical protein